MASTFRRIKPAPLTERVRTREAFTYMYRVLRVIGWLPPKELFWRNVYSIWTFVFFVIVVFYLPVAFLISYVTEFRSFSPSEFLLSIQGAFNVLGASINALITYNCLWRLKKIQTIFDRLDERLLNDGDRQKIHDIVARCNYIFLIYTFCYCIGVAVQTGVVVSGSPPWAVYIPFLNWRAGKVKLYIQTILEFITVTFVVLHALIPEAGPLLFALIFRKHFEVLKDHIRNLRMDPDKTEQENYEELTNCIMDHKLILRCCDLLRPMVFNTVFVQFVLIGSILGLTLFNILFFANLWETFCGMNYVFILFLQTFPFCYICNLLFLDGEDLANVIFHSNWVDSEPRFKNTLINFMHHVQQPIIFKAGGIFVISVNSFITVAKFALTIITIAREMNFVENFQ
ncbi:odorant receptor 59b [Drosophila grimshawi]|uniref:odorant receptor 59b n=1 Tax=Drosophila grimshawi TaxID=7222 RepID=UPI000C87109D|nr:odorant receptor 59b [Drosophila grimshawi]